MFKSILRISLLLMLTIGIGIASFIYGIDRGYKYGVIQSTIYVLDHKVEYDLSNFTSTLILQNHLTKEQLRQQNTDRLINLLEFYFHTKKLKPYKNEQYYFDKHFIDESSKDFTKVFFTDDINKTREYIKKFYSKEEIEKIKVFKEFLEEDSK